MLASASGDTSVRFVELYDDGGLEETFPGTSYSLKIYDAAGNPIPKDSQPLSATGMRNAAIANRPYLISTSGITPKGDETLTVTLPKPAGQACYLAFGTPYSCMTWGCITNFVSTSGTGSFHGATPPDGMSDQRQPSDSVQIAAPTPGATNKAGAGAKPCPTSATPYAGVKIPTQTSTAKHGRVPVMVRCPAKAKGRCQGTLVLKTSKKIGKPGNKHVVTLGKTSFSIAAGKAPKVKVPLSKAGKNAVRHHRSLACTATATSHDSRGRTKVTSGQVTVKRST